jgi:3-dehydroquinate synthetase
MGDKKVVSGKVKYILPKTIGTVAITDAVGNDLVMSSLEAMQADS